MKYENYSEYDPHHAALAESAFLTVWAGLGQWHGDPVLVGGMVPKYLCGDLTSARTLPRPATLDVDLGIALGADSGQYGNLLWELRGQGFKQSAINPSRLEKKIGDITVPLDFLAEHPVDDMLSKSGVMRSLYNPTRLKRRQVRAAGEHLVSLNTRTWLVMYGQELNPESYATGTGQTVRRHTPVQQRL